MLKNMRKSTPKKPTQQQLLDDMPCETDSAIPNHWKKPNGFVSGNVLSPSSRLYQHRQRSLNAFERGFDDIDYAFPGQKNSRD